MPAEQIDAHGRCELAQPKFAHRLRSGVRFKELQPNGV